MKSIFYSRFFILLPWVLIVIIVMDIDTKRSSVRSTAGSYLARLGDTQRRERPAHAAPAGANRTALQPLIYAVTPTYSRAVQKAELTRLANTFRQVHRFHWVVVEDAGARTELVARFLARCGVPYTHLHALTPRRFKRSGMPRATEQRNAALGWLRTHRATREPGVVFFADDDNTYSLELFEEMRSTRGVSVWPVGLVGGRRYERPIVENGKVVGWYTGWRADRPFAIDMAGFAVNLQVILANPRALFKRRGAKPGMQESDFLKQITRVEDLEPKAKNCTQVLVWHTRTEKVNLGNEPKRHQDSLMIEV
ncbi:galactosylgalactosylxylosylprotein 3-beta-glucuronosyltransferase 2 [Colossoma macropomum]|uniref:galactosylgalactosylxylosylprotein 3-beta-glucuronosyltransferase 2 n=1 Tax=Colossoma macropomum TaxID=42526 RepID=UPI001864D147|nr:galactosylgalactosylxylosylprotein 3-beta-glucuronosyltransferase 2 [Colossoma macropomum]